MEEPVFTKNETVVLMHQNTSEALIQLADHIEKWQMDYRQVVNFLRETSDEIKGQSMAVALRDELGIKIEKLNN
jgi:hypothetical protein